MRVNANMLPNVLADLQQSQSTLNTLLQELATGKSVNAPSDDPAAASQMVQNTLASVNLDRYTSNISSALLQVQSAGSVLSSVVSELTKAVSLGTEGANGTNTPASLAVLAQQVQSILSTVISQANTTVSGVFLFGGTGATDKPYAADSSATSGYSYSGNDGANSITVGDGVDVQVTLPGSQVFSNSSNDVLGALSSLMSALQSGDAAKISSATNAVSSSIQLIGQAQGFYGNAANQLNAQESYLQQDKVTLTSQQNNLVGADIAKVSTELSQAETAHAAALAAAAKVLPTTLLNYLSTPA